MRIGCANACSGPKSDMKDLAYAPTDPASAQIQLRVEGWGLGVGG